MSPFPLVWMVSALNVNFSWFESFIPSLDCYAHPSRLLCSKDAFSFLLASFIAPSTHNRIPTKLDPYNFLPCFLPSIAFTTSISRWYGCHLNCWNDLRVLTLKAIIATLFLGSQSIIHSLETIDGNYLDKSQNIIHSMLYQTRSHTSTNRQLEEHWTKKTQSLRTWLEALLK